VKICPGTKHDMVRINKNALPTARRLRKQTKYGAKQQFTYIHIYIYIHRERDRERISDIYIYRESDIICKLNSQEHLFGNHYLTRVRTTALRPR
jgi:hypothetical protein